MHEASRHGCANAVEVLLLGGSQVDPKDKVLQNLEILMLVCQEILILGFGCSLLNSFRLIAQNLQTPLHLAIVYQVQNLSLSVSSSSKLRTFHGAGA